MDLFTGNKTASKATISLSKRRKHAAVWSGVSMLEYFKAMTGCNA